MEPFVNILNGGGERMMQFVDFSEDADRGHLTISMLPKKDADAEEVDDILRAIIDTARLHVHNGVYLKCSVEMLVSGDRTEELAALYIIEDGKVTSST
jgi:hypothetical protein